MAASTADLKSPWNPAPKGLEGVVVANTMISKIDGKAGNLIYRGYDIRDLAGKFPFEAVAYLLWVGHLPNEIELSTFRDNLAKHRRLPKEVKTFLDSVPSTSDPLAVLRTAVSIMGLAVSENSPLLEDGIKLAARFPTINAYFERLRKGHEPIEPSQDLGHAANYIYMLTGKSPTKEQEHALNTYLTLLADHGMNASTFSARVTISTLTDLYSAIVAAIGTLKGPLHGGAPSKVWEMLQQVKDPENAASWVAQSVAKGDRIMGFGHRIYRTEDPRSKILKELARMYASPRTFALAETVEREARTQLQKKHPERALDTNVEFYSCLVLHSAGIPIDMFTPTFASARVFGWIAHIMEQLADNRIFRPDSEYVGPLGLKVPEK